MHLRPRGSVKELAAQLSQPQSQSGSQQAQQLHSSLVGAHGTFSKKTVERVYVDSYDRLASID